MLTKHSYQFFFENKTANMLLSKVLIFFCFLQGIASSLVHFNNENARFRSRYRKILSDFSTVFVAVSVSEDLLLHMENLKREIVPDVQTYIQRNQLMPIILLQFDSQGSRNFSDLIIRSEIATKTTSGFIFERQFSNFEYNKEVFVYSHTIEQFKLYQFRPYQS
jgi:hypothetical protein